MALPKKNLPKNIDSVAPIIKDNIILRWLKEILNLLLSLVFKNLTKLAEACFTWLVQNGVAIPIPWAFSKVLNCIAAVKAILKFVNSKGAVSGIKPRHIVTIRLKNSKSLSQIRKEILLISFEINSAVIIPQK